MLTPRERRAQRRADLECIDCGASSPRYSRCDECRAGIRAKKARPNEAPSRPPPPYTGECARCFEFAVPNDPGGLCVGCRKIQNELAAEGWQDPPDEDGRRVRHAPAVKP